MIQNTEGRKVGVDVTVLLSIYCDLHNLLLKVNPTWFESKVLGVDAKDNLNERIAFIKKKLITQIENGLHTKVNLPKENNIFLANFEDICSSILKRS